MTHPQWSRKRYANCKSALDGVPKKSGAFICFTTSLRYFSLIFRHATMPLLLFLQSNYNVMTLYLRSQPLPQANKSSFRGDGENILWAAGWNAADELVIRNGKPFLLFVSPTFMSLAEQTWLGCVCSKVSSILTFCHRVRSKCATDLIRFLFPAGPFALTLIKLLKSCANFFQQEMIVIRQICQV